MAKSFSISNGAIMMFNINKNSIDQVQMKGGVDAKTKPDPITKQAEQLNASQDYSEALKVLGAKTTDMLSRISAERRESDLPTGDESSGPAKKETPAAFKTEKEKKDENKGVDENVEVKPEDVTRR